MTAPCSALGCFLVLAASAPLEAQESPAPEVWRVARVTVSTASTGSAEEVRVVRADGSAVSIEAGLRDVGWQNKLQERARPKKDAQSVLRDNVGRLGVMGVGAAMGVGGVAMVGVGSVLWAVSLQQQVIPDSFPVPRTVWAEGMFLVLTGVVAVVAACFALGVAAVPWLVEQTRGPAPPDPHALQRLGAQLSWNEQEATAVVQRHNAGLAPAGDSNAEAPEQAAENVETPQKPSVRAGPQPGEEGAVDTRPPPPPPPPLPGTPTRKKARGRR